MGVDKAPTLDGVVGPIEGDGREAHRRVDTGSEVLHSQGWGQGQGPSDRTRT